MTPTNKPKEVVTVIGPEAMGTAFTKVFLRCDHPVTVRNRTSDKADPLVAKGAIRAKNTF